MDITFWENTINDRIKQVSKRFSKDSIEDLRQDLYLAILENEAKIQEAWKDGGAAAQKLVREICNEKILEVAKDYGVSIDSVDDPKVRNEIDSAVEEITNYGINRQEVATAVLGLPELEQAVVRAIFYENMSLPEVATRFGRPLAWVVNTKKSALGRLSQTLRRK